MCIRQWLDSLVTKATATANPMARRGSGANAAEIAAMLTIIAHLSLSAAPKDRLLLHHESVKEPSPIIDNDGYSGTS